MSSIRSLTQTLTPNQNGLNALVKKINELNAWHLILMQADVSANKSETIIKSIQEEIKHGNQLGKEAFHYANKDNDLSLELKKAFHHQFRELNKALIALTDIALGQCSIHDTRNQSSEHKIEFQFYRLQLEQENFLLYPTTENDILTIKSDFKKFLTQWQALAKEAKSSPYLKYINQNIEQASFKREKCLIVAEYNFALNCMNDASNNQSLNHYRLAWLYLNSTEDRATHLFLKIKDPKQQSLLLSRLGKIISSKSLLLKKILTRSPEYKVIAKLSEHLAETQKKLFHSLGKSHPHIVVIEECQKTIVAYIINKKMDDTTRRQKYHTLANQILNSMSTFRETSLNVSKGLEIEEINDLSILLQRHTKIGCTTTSVATRLGIEPKMDQSRLHNKPALRSTSSTSAIAQQLKAPLKRKISEEKIEANKRVHQHDTAAPNVTSALQNLPETLPLRSPPSFSPS